MEANQVLKRAEVPVEQTWNLEAIFPSVEEWEKALNGIEAEIKAGTAIGLGHLGAEQASRSNLFPGFAVDDSVPLMIVQAGLDHVGKNAANRIAKGAMVFAKGHAGPGNRGLHPSGLERRDPGVPQGGGKRPLSPQGRVSP